ncbi:MAG TPA: exodeoxyribonuclease V subunit alpha [Gemmatimonadales bacterium]
MSAHTLPTPEALGERGLLRAVDVRFARAAERMQGAATPLELLALALASRAPGAGHVCVELHDVARLVRPERDDALLRWPDASTWTAALRESPFVSSACATDGGSPAGERRPLVLDGERLYLHRYWRYQQRLVAALGARAGIVRDDVDEALLRDGLLRLFPRSDAAPAEPDPGPDWQRIAACTALLRGLAVITGGPGTGKTTTVAKILMLLVDQARAGGTRLRVALAAPTGKAAARMAEAIRGVGVAHGAAADHASAIPSSASTLHRLLGWDPRHPTRFRHHAGAPLPADVVIVDEVSMVDLALMAKLVDAVPPHARLILLGDRDQLASVEAGAILGDICGAGASGCSAPFAERVRALCGEGPHAAPEGGPPIADCVVRLTRSHRFTSGGGIGALARAVNDGDDEGAMALLAPSAEALERDERAEVVRVVPPPDARDAFFVRDIIVDGYREYLATPDPDAALVALERFRVLCAHRDGPFGARRLNAAASRWLVEARLLPPAASGDEGWYDRRPIIITENDAQLDVFNGDTGVIMMRDGRPRAFLRATDGGVRELAPSRLPSHETVFAMTVHRSQGSEFDSVVMLLPGGPSPVLTRELLYTGISRARSLVTVVGTDRVLRHAIAGHVQRASGITEQLWRAAPEHAHS